MKSVSVIVPLKGISTGKSTIRIETSGYTGQSCKNATEALEKMFGGQQTEELKQEYYEQAEGVERITQGGTGSGESS